MKDYSRFRSLLSLAAKRCRNKIRSFKSPDPKKKKDGVYNSLSIAILALLARFWGEARFLEKYPLFFLLFYLVTLLYGLFYLALNLRFFQYKIDTAEKTVLIFVSIIPVAFSMVFLIKFF